MEVRDEMDRLESALASVKQDYEMLRIEFERVMAMNDQAAPVVKCVDYSSILYVVHMPFLCAD